MTTAMDSFYRLSSRDVSRAGQAMADAFAEQHKGLGGSLLRALMKDCDEQKLPIFLETETEENVRMYEYFGFKVIKKITLDKLGLPMWEMYK